jgi:glucokinase
MTANGGTGRGYLLAADVGGTKTALALAAAGSPPQILVQRIFPSQSHPSLQSLLVEFLDAARAEVPGAPVAAACFALAGPVEGDFGTLTNLGWKVEAELLKREFHLGRVKLVNDFAAAGRGIELLGPSDIETLQAGRPAERGVRLVVGAGTGLGMSLITWQSSGYSVHPTEAGHADFAPVNSIQDQLLLHLRREFGRVSYERVVSGPGLARVFAFLQASGTGTASPELQDALRQRDGASEVIAEFAMARHDPVAVKAVDIFVTAYGAFAGNMALASLAHGGVFLAGGIASKIAPKLRDGVFMGAFVNKGRFRDLLATIPVHVVMTPQVGLYGALLEADRLRAETA